MKPIIKKERIPGEDQVAYAITHKFSTVSNSLKRADCLELYGDRDSVSWINAKAKKGSKNINYYVFNAIDYKNLNAFLNDITLKEDGLTSRGYDLGGVKSFNRNVWLDLSRESNAIEGILDDFSFDLLDFRAKLRGQIALDPSTQNFDRYEYFKKLYNQYKAVEANNDSIIIDGQKQKHSLSMELCAQFIAFKYAYKCAKKDRYKPLGKTDLMDMILYVNALLSGNEFGRFRNEQRYIQDQTKEDRKANWIPVTPDKISEKMDALCEWATDKNQGEKLHPIEKAAIFHAEFERIHPFSDGNGRTGRIISNYLLMKDEFPTISIRYKHTLDYFKAVSKAIETHEVDDLIKLFSDAVLDSAKKIDECLDYIQKQQKIHSSAEATK